MASSPSSPLFIFFAVFLLFALRSHAREPQSFTKLTPSVYGDAVAAEAAKDQYPQKSEPVFQQENQNAYGLVDQNRAAEKEHTATGVDFHRYLPKNYNPVAYVTKPEDFSEQNKIQGEERFSSAVESEYSGEKPFKYNYERYNNNNNGGGGHGSYFGTGSRFQGLSSTSLRGGGDALFHAGGDRFPQGMSDTRAMESGRYFYDVNSERFNGNHPYEMMKEGGYNSNRYFTSNGRNYGNGFPGESSAVAGEGYQYGNWP